MDTFIRLHNDNIETAVRTYEKEDKSVIFAGNIHEGLPEYYRYMQTKLDVCDRIMFEKMLKIELREELRTYFELFEFWSMCQPKVVPESNLGTIHNCIDYSMDGWVHWDIDWREMREEFKRRFPTKEDVRDVRSEILDFYKQRGWKKTLGNKEYVEYLVGFPYDAVGSALIEYRDANLLEGVKQYLNSGIKCLGVLYGTAHGDVVETYLINEERFERRSETWLINR